MSFILSIETATPVCSIALHSSGNVIAASHHYVSQSASSKLALMIDELLKRCDLEPKQLDGIAVSAGPGSYTGLRIGVATAKGMCYALSIPLMAVNTLDCLVKQVNEQFHGDELLCPMIDARRMEVYCQLVTSKGEKIEETQARIIDEQSFKNYLDKSVIVFFGSGADKCKEVIRSKNAKFLSDIHPSAQQVGELASKKFENKQFENVAEFEPFYLKDFLIKKPKSAH